MSDLNENTEMTDTEINSADEDIFTNTEVIAKPDEKTVLLERARNMGLKVSNNIGLDTLRERIKEAQEGKKPEPELEDEPQADEPAVETYAARMKRVRMDALKLVRIRVTCMNPAKKDYLGEVFTVANKYIGNVKKFVPFGEATDNGYHVPKVIYEEMKRRRFTSIKPIRRNGIDVIIPENMRDVPEFAIEVLEPLTEKELNDLKIQQARSGSTLDN